jgi:hypothetical protein
MLKMLKKAFDKVSNIQFLEMENQRLAWEVKDADAEIEYLKSIIGEMEERENEMIAKGDCY